jgi:parallel beta-helix repeat protein
MKKKSAFSLPVLFVLLLIICMSAVPVYSAILQVPTQHATINKALAAGHAGDTIKVAAGIYFEHITMKKGVTLEGGWNKDFTRRDIPSFVTVLDGAKEKGAVVIGADQAVLDGFTIIHASLLEVGDESIGSGIYCKATSPTIKNNTVRDNEPSGVFCDNSAAVVVGNRIAANAQAGIYMQKGSSLKISGNTILENNYSGIGCGKAPASKFEITANIIHDNKRSGINAETATGTIQNNLIYDNKRAGIRVLPMPVSMINNTIVGNGWTGILVEDPTAVAIIKNNIITHNRDTGIRSADKGYDYNLLFANGETGDCDPHFLWCVKPQFGGYGDETSYLKQRNIIADPLFVDLAGHDYHLQPGSPAIDAGDRKPEFNDAHLPPSLGSPRNDMGFFGGTLTVAEKRKGNTRPQAVAAESEMEVFAGRRAVLDGKGSVDPEGDAITYQWTLVKKPETSKAKLSRPDKIKTAFKADVPGSYEAQLVVTDALGEVSEPQIVKITVPGNRLPEANIGEVISQVSAGDTITFYGTASKDPEGSELQYAWSLLYKPETSKATLASGNQDSCSFLIDVDGSYTVQLIVNDGEFDSKPVTVNVSTRNAVTAGVRRVPEEYPTIQSALDAAAPGDDIIVQGGRYEELVVIDKSVNLIGKDWPVIDGGSQAGNKNTVSIFYLGDRAGKLEGFVITGGGTGDLGHAINVWDSSPDIFNNKITGNNHGMGIHGSPALTSKTKVHGNLVYGNLVGIGNGKDSNARIYNNRIYNNSVVGVGCRGKAKPRIEANYIYGNRLGVGAREVASPSIEGNHIFNNTDGIVISPLSTIKKFAFDDILITNNLIVNNNHLGINITSFNLSKVIITNNTIDSNNKGKRKIRGGGVILGYPQPATFTAVVENNIISNNQVAGISKYIGPDTFQKPGAILNNDRNNLWKNTTNYLDCQAGGNALSQAPVFDGAAGNMEEYVQKTASGKVADLGYQFAQSAFAELPPEEL